MNAHRQIKRKNTAVANLRMRSEVCYCDVTDFYRDTGNSDCDVAKSYRDTGNSDCDVADFYRDTNNSDCDIAESYHDTGNNNCDVTDSDCNKKLRIIVSRVGMSLIIDLFQLLESGMRVDFRRGNAFVPQKLLYGLQFRAVIKHCRGK